MVPFFFPLRGFCDSRVRKGEEPSGDVLRLIQIRLATTSLEKITPASQDNLAPRRRNGARPPDVRRQPRLLVATSPSGLNNFTNYSRPFVLYAYSVPIERSLSVDAALAYQFASAVVQ
jgi:hypothetical protein